MSSVNLEGLEIKEATPSITTTIYENEQYTKWKIFLAIGIGVCLIGFSMLIFYVSAEAKISKRENGSMLDNLKGNAWRRTMNEECFAFSRPACPKDFGEKTVLFLVLGGLRIDQLSEIPALSELTRCGVKAESLVPSYPSFSYPNLYSLSTGLYTESHGVVSDMNDNGTRSLKSLLDSQIQPLWEVLRKNRRKTASYNWPGAETDLKNNNSNTKPGKRLPFVSQIREMLEWLKLPKRERPRLIMMYYEEPGQTAMNFGPFSPETTQELVNINFGLDEIMTSLEQMNIFNCLDLMVVSDHGVAASLCKDTIVVDQLLTEKLPGQLYSGSVGRINFNNDADSIIVNRVTQSLQCKEAALKALPKHQVPKRYHYTNNENIGEIILDTKSGYRLITEDNNNCSVGQFGYDPLLRSMQGAFVSYGPSFKIGYKTTSFRNVEIYNLILHILKVNPKPNNGTTDSLLNLLKRSYKLRGSYATLSKKQFLKTALKNVPKRTDNGIIKNSKNIEKCSCEVRESNGREIKETNSKMEHAKSSKVTTVSAEVKSTITTIAETSFSTSVNSISETLQQSSQKLSSFENKSSTNKQVSSDESKVPTSTKPFSQAVSQIQMSLSIKNSLSTTSESVLTVETNGTTVTTIQSSKSLTVNNQSNVMNIPSSTERINTQSIMSRIFLENDEIKTSTPELMLRVETISANGTLKKNDSSNLMKQTNNVAPSFTENISTVTASPPNSLKKSHDTSTLNTTLAKHAIVSTSSFTGSELKYVTTPSVTVINKVNPLNGTDNKSPIGSAFLSGIVNTFLVSGSAKKTIAPELTNISISFNNFEEETTTLFDNFDASTPVPISTKLREINSTLIEEQNRTLDQIETNKKNNVEDEIEILPLPAALKSMSLIKDGVNQYGISELQNLHTPWGFPLLSAPEVSSDILSVLPHSSHILGFPESLGVAVWTSFTLTNTKLKEIKKHRPSVPDELFLPFEERKSHIPIGCWISDSRIQRFSSDQCSRTFGSNLYESQNISLRQLYPEELEVESLISKEGFLLTNLAPVRKGFEKGPRGAILNAIEKWVEEWEKVNVLHGPVFDYDFDGQRDSIITIRNTIKPLIPSDYFYVITICNKRKDQSQEGETINNEDLLFCPFTHLEVYSFILPNADDNNMCFMSDREYLQYHLASLADVEELTSLRTFSHLPSSEHAQLRARQPLTVLPF